MASRHTNLQASNSDGNQLSVNETTTDSPILPAANLEHLRQIDPSLVGWVVEQTEIEANFRRSETKRINTFVFAERISGVIAGGVVAIGGLLVSAFLAIQGHEWVASILGGSTLVAIVTVLVVRKSSTEPQIPSKPSKPRSRRK